MRTTKKEFKTKVQEHILEGLSTDMSEDTKEQLQNVVSEFKGWYSPYAQKHTPNRQEAFTEFLTGLPSGLNTEFTYYGISNTLKNWYESCGAEYKEATPDKEAKLYYGLVYRELRNLTKRNGVDF